MSDSNIIKSTEEEYFYLSSSLIFGSRDIRTKKYSIYKYLEITKTAELEVKEFSGVNNHDTSGRYSTIRALKIGEHIIETDHVDSGNVARNITLRLFGRLIVSDTIVSEEHFSRLNQDFKKTQLANIHAVAVLLKLLHEKWLVGLAVLMNDLPNIATLLLHERERLK
jgi:hypothetical protein